MSSRARANSPSWATRPPRNATMFARPTDRAPRRVEQVAARDCLGHRRRPPVDRGRDLTETRGGRPRRPPVVRERSLLRLPASLVVPARAAVHVSAQQPSPAERSVVLDGLESRDRPRSTCEQLASPSPSGSCVEDGRTRARSSPAARCGGPRASSASRSPRRALRIAASVSPDGVRAMPSSHISSCRAVRHRR